MINSKMAEINKSELLDKMDKYRKLDKTKLREEKFEVKSYLKSLTPSQARMKFRLNSFMTKTVKMNFSSNPKFVKSLWTCWHHISCTVTSMNASDWTKILTMTRSWSHISSKWLSWGRIWTNKFWSDQAMWQAAPVSQAGDEPALSPSRWDLVCFVLFVACLK